jgi:hypothetical protein
MPSEKHVYPSRNIPPAPRRQRRSGVGITSGNAAARGGMKTPQLRLMEYLELPDLRRLGADHRLHRKLGSDRELHYIKSRTAVIPLHTYHLAAAIRLPAHLNKRINSFL